MAVTEGAFWEVQEHPELLVCAFSPDGGYVMAGANDCHCYVWAWGEGEGADWTAAEAPTELCRLAGHKNDILLLQFSHDCGAFGTGSRDGTLRVRPCLISSMENDVAMIKRSLLVAEFHAESMSGNFLP